jgi:hypothetical protein
VRLRQRAIAERATLLYWLDGRSLWKHLGAKSLVAYAGRALGMPPKDLREGLRLRARLSMLPKVRAACLRGMLPAFAARQVANIASRETEDAWIEHLQDCTGKRIDAELRWHELALHALDIAEYRRLTDGGKPQPGRTMHQLRYDIDLMAHECAERVHRGWLRLTRAKPAPADDFYFDLPHVGERWHEGVRVTM